MPLRKWFSNKISKSTPWQLALKTGEGWLDDKAPRLGASLAFYSVLSLAPLALLLLSLASYLWGQDTAQNQLIRQMTSILGSQAAAAIETTLTKNSENHQAGLFATLAGLFMLLLSASGMFGELQSAMNIIWKIKPRDKQPLLNILKERAFSFLMVLGSGALLFSSVIVSAAVTFITTYINSILPEAQILMQLGDFLISLGVIAFIFALIFRVVPDIAIQWRSVWVGGILTAILFVTGKTILGLYLANVGIASTYGAAGSIVVLLLWIYYSAQILFLGAEFTYIYSSHYKLHEAGQR